MTDEEWVALLWPLWLHEWWTAGTQDHRRELLAAKARIEVATGWCWSPPYSLDNPPRIALLGGADG